ncbi:hypothetical protein H6764_03340 [Candidatus Nomurabacteria bacterium]|nr:hypothetical protein [Candidatus Nomurabacteria bacterium]
MPGEKHTLKTQEIDCGVNNSCQEVIIQGDSKYVLPNGKQGDLLLVTSPDDWNKQAGDYNYKGCVVFEIESLENPSLKNDSSDNPIILAEIKDSQVKELGSAACSYNTSSIAGILFTQRIKNQEELTVGLWQTYVNP